MNCTNRRNFLALSSAWLFANSSSASVGANTNSTPTLLDINQSPLVPWPNGKGLRRELIQRSLGDAGKPGDYAWRVGTAYVNADAPFSSLPGIDRWITLVDGDGFRMESPDSRANHVLSKQLAPHFFPGEAPIESKLIGSRSEVFNLMLRRGIFAGDVQKAETGTVARFHSTLLFYCTRGQVSLDAGDDPSHQLTAGQAAMWQQGSPELIVNLNKPTSAGLVVRVWPVAG